MQVLARRSAVAVVRLLVVLLTLGTSLPFAAHGDAGHDPCDEAETSAEAGASLHAAGPDAARQHCEVCHWLRSLRAFDVLVHQPAGGAERIHPTVSMAASSVSQLSVRQAPSRAPPA